MRNTLLKSLLFLLIVVALGSHAKAQKDSKDDSLVQFSGLIMSSDSLMALSDVNIRIKGHFYGTISNTLGIFTLVAKKNDTIMFTSIGYKPKQYIVPSNLSSQRYSMVITLASDTFVVDTVFIKPFISNALLPHYFATVDIPEDEMEVLARRNLEAEFLKQQAAAMPADAAENQDFTIRQEAAKYYYQGQAPPINILNPFAWAQFIKAWKNGDFKNKNKKK